MKLKWAPRAKQAHLAVLIYLKEEFGSASAVKFNNEIKEVIAQIKKFPKSGAPEDLLPKGMNYRSVLVGEYSKLVYRELEEEIHIDDIWDTRREPKKQALETINTESED